MSLVLDIAWTHVRARARQTVVGVLGVAMGVGFSIMMAALMEGSQKDFVATLVNALPHVTVTDERRDAVRRPAEEVYAAVAVRGLKADDVRRGIANPAETLGMLEAWVPGAAGPYVSVRAVARVTGTETGIAVLGIDPRRDVRVSNLSKQMREGGIDALSRASNGVLIGSKLAEKLGARIGSRFTVTAGNGVVLQVQVVGLFHAGVRTIDETQVYALTKTAQILSGRTGYVNEIRIRLDDPLEARAVAEVVAARTGYKATSWQEANEDLMSAFMIRNVIMYTVVSAILLVASFGTYNIISTITHEKARDIAILKSLGFTETTLRRIFLIEGLMIGLAGAVMGFALGWAMCRGLGLIEFSGGGFSDMTRLPVNDTIPMYLLAAAIALGASAIASFYPARKAAKGRPVDIIRGAT